jgi:hypothetical protein
MGAAEWIALGGLSVVLVGQAVYIAQRLTRIETKLDILWELLPCLTSPRKKHETSASSKALCRS